MAAKKNNPKKATKPAPKKPVAKASGDVTYNVTCDGKGNIKSIVPAKKK